MSKIERNIFLLLKVLYFYVSENYMPILLFKLYDENVTLIDELRIFIEIKPENDNKITKTWII